MRTVGLLDDADLAEFAQLKAHEALNYETPFSCKNEVN